MKNNKHTISTSASSLALVPVQVEDWTLFAGQGGDHWIRDLDLAERAELKRPHDIRAHIRKALDDDLIIPAVGRNDRSPAVREVPTTVVLGKGATREVTEYYLNEEAALLLVTRLRTPKAIELTKAIARVFLAVVRGDAPRVSEQGMRALVRQEVRDALKDANLPVLPPPSGKIGPEGASGVKARIDRIAAIWVSAGRSKTIKSARGSISQILRGTPGVSHGGSGSGWAELTKDREAALSKSLDRMESEAKAWSRILRAPVQSDLFEKKSRAKRRRTAKPRRGCGAIRPEDMPN